MSNLQLFAVTPAAPCALAVPDDATDFLDLYDGLALGVYTALRTYAHNQFLHLADHLARLQQSIRVLGWDYKLDELSLRRTLHTVCTAAPFTEMRVRIDVLATPLAACGVTSRVLVALMPFTPPPATLYAHGVAVGIAVGLARDNPQVKLADFATRRRTHQPPTTPVEQAPYEQLMVNAHGELMEGVSSNFYGIRQRRLYTAGNGVLEGVTRHVILELAAAAAIPICLEPVRMEAVGQLDEAAISSSSRGLIPVVKIGEHTIGAGEPGPICRQLMAAYDAHVAHATRTAIDESV